MAKEIRTRTLCDDKNGNMLATSKGNIIERI